LQGVRYAHVTRLESIKLMPDVIFIQRKCLGISVDMIRKVLKDLRVEGRIKCLGMGKAAQWKRTGKWRN